MKDNRKYHLIKKRKSERIIADAKRYGCVLCGYNKCSHALDFHHVNPAVDGKVRGHGFRDMNAPQLLSELRKCIVVCANCHREIHAGQIEGYEHVERARVVPEGYEDLPLLRLVGAS
jgi:hypothetical protein